MHKKCLEFIKKNYASQEGKRFLITGSSNGLGLEAAKVLLYLDGEVTFMVRNKEKAEKVIKSISQELGKEIKADIVLYDQSSPQSIRDCANSLKGRHYDAIALNAGIYFPKKGSVGVSQIPLTMQVNALGTALCFDYLFPLFPNAKYVFVDSIVATRPKKEGLAPYFDPNHKDRFKEYGISKEVVRAVFYNALNKDAKAYMTHPGIAKTGIIGGFAPFIKKLANGIFYPFSHPTWKAALGISLLCANDYPSGTALAPRALFEIYGYPKEKGIPKGLDEFAKQWQEYYEASLLPLVK